MLIQTSNIDENIILKQALKWILRKFIYFLNKFKFQLCKIV